MPTEDQIEAARTKVHNMLHAADHGNHLGEMAVLRMAASGELLEALRLCEAWIVDLAESGDAGFWDASKAPEVIAARVAIAKATGAGEHD